MTVPPRDVFLLVIHGSRDPRPAQAVAQLAHGLTQRLSARGASPPLIETAALECADRPLHEQILQISHLPQVPMRLHVVPLFLLAGVHVIEDVPQEVALAQSRLPAAVTVQLTPHLGRSPLMRATLEQLFQTREAAQPAAPAARIILSHGSRRPGSMQDAIAIADQLGASLAYWSTLPQLKDQVADFVRAGQRRITVLPYFLFPGGITEAIAQQVQQLREVFANLEICTTPTLSESAGFEGLIAEFVSL